MKRLSLCLLPVVLSGCVQTQNLNKPNLNKPSETIPNPKCENIPALEVFQVLDKFVLASACKENETFRDICFSHEYVVYFAKEKDKIYYDDQKIIPASGQCFEYVGTYRYTTTANTNKVVPKAKLVSSRIANPEYEIWKKDQQTSDK